MPAQPQSWSRLFLEGGDGFKYAMSCICICICIWKGVKYTMSCICICIWEGVKYAMWCRVPQMCRMHILLHCSSTEDYINPLIQDTRPKPHLTISTIATNSFRNSQLLQYPQYPQLLQIPSEIHNCYNIHNNHNCYKFLEPGGQVVLLQCYAICNKCIVAS